MLCELFIQNLAVIEETTVQFNRGLNVFTGETGAGKSIIIDAINAVLGQRTSKEIVRHGTKKATIIAKFVDVNNKVKDKLNEFGYEQDDNELIITREIFADSKSTARIMGRPVSVGILKEIGTELINIHGQHDNQILLSDDKHIDILDKYGDFFDLQNTYLECYKNVVKIKREMKNIMENNKDKAQRIDVLSYQINQIVEADLKISEDIELEEKRNRIKNSKRIVQNLILAYNALNGNDGEGGGVELVKIAAKSVEAASEDFNDSSKIATKLSEMGFELQEMASDLVSMIESLDFNQKVLDEIEARLDIIYKLKRNYGNTIEEILNTLYKAEEELKLIEVSDELLKTLNDEAKKEYARLLDLANEITKMRKLSADKFVESVTEEVKFLDMPNVKLVVEIGKVKPNSKGQDSVEFLISTNKGEPPKPIAKIASGGELSRIMLAIKNTLADKDDIETLIFDEIDTGVSGRAAQKIGLKLKQAAKNRQILSVTHLAQIAALADHHFLIKKESDENKTYTNVFELDMDGRVNEVARIMSTDTITDLMLDTARQMING